MLSSYGASSVEVRIFMTLNVDGDQTGPTLAVHVDFDPDVDPNTLEKDQNFGLKVKLISVVPRE